MHVYLSRLTLYNIVVFSLFSSDTCIAPQVSKIFGSGPQVVQECMIDQFYK